LRKAAIFWRASSKPFFLSGAFSGAASAWLAALWAMK
jgi:hypothetical protein